MKKFFILVLLLTCEINGSDWKLVHFEKFQYVQAINCPDSNKCYALVNHPGTGFTEAGWRLYSTTDQGHIWEMKYRAKNIFEQEGPQVINVNEGVSPHPNYYFVVSDDNDIILKSTDGGVTFKKLFLDEGSGYLDDLAMYDTLIGFATDFRNYYTTKDGWETFMKYPKLNLDQTYYSPQFLDSNTVVMTYASRENPNGFAFLKYLLDANKWDTLSYFGLEPDSIIEHLIRPCHIFFLKNNLGFASGSIDTKEKKSIDYISRTTDGGYNWDVIHKVIKAPYVGFYNNINFHDEKNGIALGYFGKIAMTNDGGNTWFYEPQPNEMDDAGKMLVCWAGCTPLIGTWDAGIFRYEGDFFKFPPEDTTGVEELLITNYELLITPNPAGEYIEIIGDSRRQTSFDKLRMTDGRQNENIRIYNIFGQCVMSVGAGSEPAHTTIRIDISHLPVGMYFVRFGEKIFKFVKY